MNVNRQQQRYLERQEAKAAKRAGRAPRPIDHPHKPFLTKTRVLLAIVASIIGIGTSALAYWPSMDIIAQPWETSTDPANARFQFKNTGRTTIRGIRFDCLINSAGAREFRTSGSSSKSPLTGDKSQIIGELKPDQYVSRDCVAGARISTGGHPSNIRIDASFLFPLIEKNIEISRYFVSETDGIKFWMTPEPLPK